MVVTKTVPRSKLPLTSVDAAEGKTLRVVARVESASLQIQGLGSFSYGTLEAAADGSEGITLTDTISGQTLLAAFPYTSIKDQQGNPLSSQAQAIMYLQSANATEANLTTWAQREW